MIETFLREITVQYPDFGVHVDRPAKPTGSWFIDIRTGTKIITVEFREGQGFGFCDCVPPEVHGYGEGPDVVVLTVEEALARLQDETCQ